MGLDFYLSWQAKEWDFRTRFIELAGQINANMTYHVLDSVAKALNQHKKALNGAKVMVLGLAYKKDINDLRESPSLTIIELLQKQGARASYNDPYFPTVGKGRFGQSCFRDAPEDNVLITLMKHIILPDGVMTGWPCYSSTTRSTLWKTVLPL